MMMRKIVWMSAAMAMLGVAAIAGAGGAQPRQRPLARQLAKGVEKFLEVQGDLCVGKYNWPRDVTPAERGGGSNDAIQLPVLERLGLVESTEVPADTVHGAEATTRYSLTEKGRQYYLYKKRVALEAGEKPVEHEGDFCVAHLSLDKVVKWTPPTDRQGELQTDVAYTYQLTSADWLSDPEARKVFPVVDRIIQGAGVLQMEATLRLKNGQWLPALPGG